MVFLALASPYSAIAQFGTGEVHLPYESQKASISQTIGITDIEVVYHRPAVKGRKIWGELVPYNSGTSIPWRGGANENTTITFSSDVAIEGKALAAGTYGLHFLPYEKEWTVIFSKNSTSWGSFSYNKDEDALRVTVKPQLAEFEEYLKYEFMNPKPASTMLQLHWEKLAVPIRIDVNTHEVVLANIRKELRNSVGFTWRGYNSAASYCADENINLEEGLAWAKRSVSSEENFDGLQTLAQLQEKLGMKDEADKTRDRAMQIAKPLEIHTFARQLLTQKKIDEAMKYFEYNLKKNPDQWFVYSGIARGYEAKGDLKAAIENMKLALEKAPEANKANISGVLKQWQSRM